MTFGRFGLRFLLNPTRAIWARYLLLEWFFNSLTILQSQSLSLSLTLASSVSSLLLSLYLFVSLFSHCYASSVFLSLSQISLLKMILKMGVGEFKTGKTTRSVFTGFTSFEPVWPVLDQFNISLVFRHFLDRRTGRFADFPVELTNPVWSGSLKPWY